MTTEYSYRLAYLLLNLTLYFTAEAIKAKYQIFTLPVSEEPLQLSDDMLQHDENTGPKTPEKAAPKSVNDTITNVLKMFDKKPPTPIRVGPEPTDVYITSEGEAGTVKIASLLSQNKSSLYTEIRTEIRTEADVLVTRDGSSDCNADNRSMSSKDRTNSTQSSLLRVSPGSSELKSTGVSGLMKALMGD